MAAADRANCPLLPTRASSFGFSLPPCGGLIRSGAITQGIKLHRNYAKGSDGRLGNDFVAVKTITPFKSCDVVEVNLERNFSKVLIMKINADFGVRGKLIDRKALPKGKVRGCRLSIDRSLIEAA